MVILLSALAVVVAAILLATWFVVGGGFTLIYAATALAVLSMVLLWAARWMGSSPEAAAPAAPEPLRELAPVTASATGTSVVGTPAEADALGVGAAPGRERGTAERQRASSSSSSRHEAADGPGDGLPSFPIAEYDTLWVAQIVPLLAELDDQELGVVEARERGGRHRAAVLDAVAAVRAGEPLPEVTSRAPRRTPVDVIADADADDLWAPMPGAEDDPSPDRAVVVVEEPTAEELAEEEARWAAWTEVAPPAADGLGPEVEGAVEEDDEPGAGADAVHDTGIEWSMAEPIEDGGSDAEVFDWTLPDLDEGSVEVPTDPEGEADLQLDAEPEVEVHVGQPAGVGGPRARTFLGRRQSSLIIRRD
ncbi:hypothetical protein BH10ACT1_BH10ACT1_31700 [soil metagenome]